MHACFFAYGHDGNLYAVFASEYEAEKSADRFPGRAPVCFGGFLNAYDVTSLAWSQA